MAAWTFFIVASLQTAWEHRSWLARSRLPSQRARRASRPRPYGWWREATISGGIKLAG